MANFEFNTEQPSYEAHNGTTILLLALACSAPKLRVQTYARIK